MDRNNTLGLHTEWGVRNETPNVKLGPRKSIKWGLRKKSFHWQMEMRPESWVKSSENL